MAKRGVLEHPKFARLKMRLAQPRGAVLGWLEAVWHFTGRYAQAGNIGKWSDDDIEAWVEWDGERGALIAALIECGWLDVSTDYRLIVHDWHDHADDATRVALKRAKQEFCRDSVPTVFRQCRDLSRPPEPEPMPEPEPVIGDIGGASRAPMRKARASPSALDSEFEQFRAVYPRRLGDSKAAKAREKFGRLRAGGIPLEAILRGAERYAAFCDATGKAKTEFVQQMPTWLNGRGWDQDWEIPDDIPNRNGRASMPVRAATILAELRGEP